MDVNNKNKDLACFRSLASRRAGQSALSFVPVWSIIYLTRPPCLSLKHTLEGFFLPEQKAVGGSA